MIASSILTLTLGVAAGLTCHPLDVAYTKRIHGVYLDKKRNKYRSPSYAKIWKSMYQAHGLRGLFKNAGYTVRYSVAAFTALQIAELIVGNIENKFDSMNEKSTTSLSKKPIKHQATLFGAAKNEKMETNTSKTHHKVTVDSPKHSL